MESLLADLNFTTKGLLIYHNVNKSILFFCVISFCAK